MKTIIKRFWKFIVNCAYIFLILSPLIVFIFWEQSKGISWFILLLIGAGLIGKIDERLSK
jgi:uncharacterized RDD family membrane protein YckC